MDLYPFCNFPGSDGFSPIFGGRDKATTPTPILKAPILGIANRIASMYGISTYIYCTIFYLKKQPSVGKYTIFGWDGNNFRYLKLCEKWFVTPKSWFLGENWQNHPSSPKASGTQNEGTEPKAILAVGFPLHKPYPNTAYSQVRIPNRTNKMIGKWHVWYLDVARRNLGSNS